MIAIKCHITNASQPSSWPSFNFSIQIYHFEANLAYIENMARIQYRQLNFQSHTCHNCVMLIRTFDLWWLKLSEVPQNPASIPSATSLAPEWLAKAIIGHIILTLSGWWAGGQGFQAGTGGVLGYQGQSQILETWESVIWILLVVTHNWSLLANWARPFDSWLLIAGDTKHDCFYQSEGLRKAK